VLGHAEKRGVFLALENHGGITSTPAQMMKIIQGVRDSKFFGVNFDGGNFRSDDPYRDMAVIAPYAINAQVKVSIFRNGKKEPADLKRVIGILRDADYRGYIVLEYEEKDPLGEIPGYLGQLRQLIS
jgi:sugar phosphate isomerase/epimerase